MAREKKEKNANVETLNLLKQFELKSKIYSCLIVTFLYAYMFYLELNFSHD